MKEINCFLNNPTLFYGSRLAPRSCVISMANHGAVTNNGYGVAVRESGKEVDGLTGFVLAWGKPDDNSRYYYGHNSANFVVRTIATEDSTMTYSQEHWNYKVKVNEQTTCRTSTSSYYQYDSNVQKFQELAVRDKINHLIMTNIPGVKELFTEYTRNTQNWWVENADAGDPTSVINPVFVNNDNNPVFLQDVTELVTDENARLANDAIERALLDRTKTASYKLTTQEHVGMLNSVEHLYRVNNGPNVPQGQRYTPLTVEEPTKIKSWYDSNRNSSEKKKLPCEPVELTTNTKSPRKDFDIEFNVRNLESAKIFAVFGWLSTNYIEDKTIRRRPDHRGIQRSTTESVSNRIYLPIIQGFVLQLNPENTEEDYLTIRPPNEEESAVNNRRQFVPVTSEAYEMESILRVRDRTKKRAVKGAYRGHYQGISSLKFKDSWILERVEATGLGAIATGPAIKSYAKIEARLPLDLEMYNKIERPNVEVKPIHIGHLKLYRLSEPPNQLVTGEILCDLLLPSMPALLISVNSDIRVTSDEESYTDGGHCSGDCAKEEVEQEVPPGLYLVERHSKCSLSHDPGRKEYNAGFGNTCNEIITVRRMLSQLNVHYDQFRGNMVGDDSSTFTHEFSATDNTGFFGRLM